MIIEYEHLGEFFRKKIEFRFSSTAKKVCAYYEDGKEFTHFDFKFLSPVFDEEFPGEKDLLNQWLKEHKVSHLSLHL